MLEGPNMRVMNNRLGNANSDAVELLGGPGFVMGNYVEITGRKTGRERAFALAYSAYINGVWNMILPELAMTLIIMQYAGGEDEDKRRTFLAEMVLNSTFGTLPMVGQFITGPLGSLAGSTVPFNPKLSPMWSLFEEFDDGMAKAFKVASGRKELTVSEALTIGGKSTMVLGNPLGRNMVKLGRLLKEE